MFYCPYALRASRGLILLILLLITKLDDRPMVNAKISIGISEKGLKENENPNERVLPISKLATMEITNSSIEAITKEIKHCINEW